MTWMQQSHVTRVLHKKNVLNHLTEKVYKVHKSPSGFLQFRMLASLTISTTIMLESRWGGSNYMKELCPHEWAR